MSMKKKDRACIYGKDLTFDLIEYFGGKSIEKEETERERVCDCLCSSMLL